MRESWSGQTQALCVLVGNSAGDDGPSRGPAVGGRFSVCGSWARVVGSPRKEVV